MLTTLTVYKVPIYKSNISCSSDQYLKPTFLLQYQHGTHQEKDDLTFFMSAIEYVNNFVKNQNFDWFRVYFGYAKKLGCSMGKYEEEREDEKYNVRILHCMNDALESDFSKDNE